MSTLTAKIQLRRDTSANWTINNPILAAGEVAFTSDVFYTSTDQQRFKIGDGVQTWTQLDYVPEGGGGGTVKIGINKVVNSSAVSGTTSNTLLDSILIPANTFKLGVAKINIRNVWTTTVSTKTTRIYINTSNSLSGATLLATQATGSTGLSVDIGRYLAVKSLSSIQVFDSTSNTPQSENSAALTTSVSNISFDSAVNNYIIVAIQQASASDSCINSFINFEI